MIKVKNSYQPKVILRVLLCSDRDLRPALAGTVIGRGGIEVYRVQKISDARLVASSLGVQIIMVDSELANGAAFIAQLRKEATTRKRSIAVLTHGSTKESDRQLRAAGANAIFRLPPDAGWDERFSRLLEVPVRQQARMLVHIKLMGELESEAAILNISPGGMLVATSKDLQIGDEFKFRFRLPDESHVVGSGRVARDAKPTGFGIEFTELQGDGESAVLDFLRSAHLGE